MWALTLVLCARLSSHVASFSAHIISQHIIIITRLGRTRKLRTTKFDCQKLKESLSYGVDVLTDDYFVKLQYTRLTDGQTERQTDTQKRYNKSAPKAPNRVIFTLKTEKLCLMSRDVALVACFTHVSLYLAKTEHIIGEKSPTRHTIGILASVDDRPIKFWRLQTSSSILRPGTKFLAPETPKRQLSEAMITSMKEL